MRAIAVGTLKSFVESLAEVGVQGRPPRNGIASSSQPSRESTALGGSFAAFRHARAAGGSAASCMHWTPLIYCIQYGRRIITGSNRGGLHDRPYRARNPYPSFVDALILTVHPEGGGGGARVLEPSHAYPNASIGLSSQDHPGGTPCKYLTNEFYYSGPLSIPNFIALRAGFLNRDFRPYGGLSIRYHF